MKYLAALSLVFGLALAQRSGSVSALGPRPTFVVIAEGGGSAGSAGAGANNEAAAQVANALPSSTPSGSQATPGAAVAGPFIVIAEGGGASPAATGSPNVASGKQNDIISGTGTDASGASCGCNCLCGTDTLPQNVAVNNFGGFAGVMKQPPS